MRGTGHDGDDGEQHKGRQEAKSQRRNGKDAGPTRRRQRTTMRAFRLARGEPADGSSDPRATLIHPGHHPSQVRQRTTRRSKRHVAPGRSGVRAEAHSGRNLAQ